MGPGAAADRLHDDRSPPLLLLLLPFLGALYVLDRLGGQAAMTAGRGQPLSPTTHT